MESHHASSTPTSDQSHTREAQRQWELAAEELRQWESAWDDYQARIPSLPFCPSVYRDDGMTTAIAHCRDVLAGTSMHDFEWIVVGPFSNRKRVGFKTDYIPQTKSDYNAVHEGMDGREVRWTPLPKANLLHDFVDADTLYDVQDWFTLYAETGVYSEEAWETTLRAGSDDGIRVMVNGETVIFRDEYRAARRGQDSARVRLNKGPNLIRVKLTEGLYGSGFYLSLDTPRGAPRMVSYDPRDPERVDLLLNPLGEVTE